VDNGGVGDDRMEDIGGRASVHLVRPGRNLGFAGGCNAGATDASGDVLVFVNQDAIVEPGALAALSAVAVRAGVGLATGSVRLADDPARINSAGNDVHFLGFSWAGAFRRPATAYPDERQVTASSGTAVAIRRELWDELGGFAEPYFAYYEDTELSFRCWQRNLSVVYVPQAIVLHRYEFSRNPRKYYLIERNRLLFVLTLFEARTLTVLLPALLLAELAVTALAVREGWLRQKVAGWGWLLRNRRWVRERRRRLQKERVRRDGALVPLLVSHLQPENIELPGGLGTFDRLLHAYWRAVRPLLAGTPASER
jgi:GT2 family glycosyltransferase